MATKKSTLLKLKPVKARKLHKIVKVKAPRIKMKRGARAAARRLLKAF